MKLAEQLKKNLLFSGLDETEIAELAAITVHRSLDKGETLFCAGEEATAFYMLVAGSIKLCRVSPDGREKVLHFVNPGETFAEAAFFGDGTYPAEARCMEPCRVLCLPKAGFMELMGRNPEFSFKLVASLSSMLRRFARQIEELTFADVMSRMASFLVHRAAEKSTVYNGITYVDLGMKKSELAARLGTAGETVSRTLRKLKDDGVIEVQGGKIVVLRMDVLKQMCE